MSTTLTCPRRQRNSSAGPAVRPATERALRDIAFVLKLTQRVGEEIRATACTPRPQ
jgi:hypothetical protein